jgi:ribose-phosphate pyrophosphokinase
MGSIKIFSGTANPVLANKISTHLGLPSGDIYHHKFPSGETYCQFKENIRGEDVFLIQPISVPANDNLMELLVMSDAARRASANKITAVIPYFGYARQDRKNKSRDPITARLVMDLLNTAGINRIITMDIHSQQIGGFTNLPFDQLLFQPLLIKHIRSIFTADTIAKKLVIISPDVGAVKKADQYASILKCDVGFISKKRIGDEQVEIQNFIGNVNDKVALILDDMTESSGTIIQAAQACKTNGALMTICAFTHPCFTDTGIARMQTALSNKIVDRLIYTNTVNTNKIDWTTSGNGDKVTEIDSSGLFATAIYNTANNKSISELYD